MLISASISLSHPFSSASESDTVTTSTVHYGILSKAILEACGEFKEVLKGAGRDGAGAPMHLRALVHFLHFYLTGEETMPKLQAPPVDATSPGRPEPVLKNQGMKMLEITVKLPKASLLGSGVSLKGTFAYDERSDQRGPSAYAMALTLHELRIPTLIGVNANERLAKQMVIATVEMDRYDRMVDAYCRLEELAVKTIEESPFQTLEALATHLSTNLIKYFLIPHFPPELKVECLEGKGRHNHQRLRISLEKPTAVMFADAPIVEVMVDSDPSHSEAMNALWKDIGASIHPPFPLQGRLADWEKEKENVKLSRDIL